jgi:glycosyltransferase involved in cell wall biosynthesis
LIKYLPEFGWDVSVLTVGNDTNYQRDNSFMMDELKNIRIVRANRLPFYNLTKRFFRRVFGRNYLMYSYLDTFYDWYHPAKLAAKRELGNMKYDAILATAPPYTTLRVAQSVSKETAIPSIADLRDPFTQNPHLEIPTKLLRNYYHNYEKKLLSSFDLLITAWPEIGEWNARAFKMDMDKFLVITNGYDPTDFERRYTLPAPSDVFTLGYFGSIYGSRTMNHLFKGFGDAIQRNPDFKNESRIVLAGAFDQLAMRKNAAKFGCEKNIEILGYQDRTVTLDLMSDCNVLVLVTGMIAQSYPGKLFDYMSSNRPILNISKRGSLTELIEITGIGVNIDGDFPEQITDFLLESFSKFKEGQDILETNAKKVEKFDGRFLAERMAIALDSVVRQ